MSVRAQWPQTPVNSQFGYTLMSKRRLSFTIFLYPSLPLAHTHKPPIFILNENLKWKAAEKKIRFVSTIISLFSCLMNKNIHGRIERKGNWKLDQFVCGVMAAVQRLTLTKRGLRCKTIMQMPAKWNKERTMRWSAHNSYTCACIYIYI